MGHCVKIGGRLGEFKLLARLGGEGAGAVYRAKRRSDNSECTLKTLTPATVEVEEIHKRFIREITVAQKLKHPNIVAYYDCGLHEDVLYYSMELVPWGSMADMLARRRALPWKDAVECSVHICQALQRLHDNQIVHRDLKPANIFLSDDGRLKVGDFGLARDKLSGRLTLESPTGGRKSFQSSINVVFCEA